MEEKVYLELSEENGTSHKFYEVLIKDTELTIRFGRIGDSGTIQKQTFDSFEKAKIAADKKIKEKTKKGYAVSVIGVRQKRKVTRREVTSYVSTSNQAPVIWSFESDSSAFGIFIENERCWLGNQNGNVFCLDHQGKVLKQYKLPDGVKCIVGDSDWIYVGCDDGKVYDLTGKLPRVSYEIEDNVDIYWLDIYAGFLAISDEKGKISVINHEEEEQWSASSKGNSGWMVRLDDSCVFHGHSKGITSYYDLEEGTTGWEQKTLGNILFGWQTKDKIYAATSNKDILCYTKTGKLHSTYKCDAAVYSCSTSEDGKLVFAGDCYSSIYCFNESGERLWKFATGSSSALSMQYFNKKLYISTSNGFLSCIDVSEEGIKSSKEGKIKEIKKINAPKSVEISDSTILDETNDDKSGIILKCVKDGQNLRVKVLSVGFKKEWNVQFPKNLRKENQYYIVDEIRESKKGSFYRTFGNIKKLRGFNL